MNKRWKIRGVTGGMVYWSIPIRGDQNSNNNNELLSGIIVWILYAMRVFSIMMYVLSVLLFIYY